MDTTARIVILMAELIREIHFIVSDEFLDGRVLPSMVGAEDHVRVVEIRKSLEYTEGKIAALKRTNSTSHEPRD